MLKYKSLVATLNIDKKYQNIASQLKDKDIESAVLNEIDSYQNDENIRSLLKEKGFDEIKDHLKNAYEKEYTEYLKKASGDAQKAKEALKESEKTQRNDDREVRLKKLKGEREAARKKKSEEREEEKKKKIAQQAKAKLEEANKKRISTINDSCPIINSSVENNVDDICSLLWEYHNEYCHNEGKPAEEYIKQWRDLKLGSVVDEETLMVFSYTRMLKYETKESSAVVTTPLGSFNAYGSKRTPIITVNIDGDFDLSYGVFSHYKTGFINSIRDCVAVIINNNKNFNRTYRQLRAWLNEPGIPVINMDDRKEISSHVKWWDTAAKIRGTSILLNSWSENVENELSILNQERQFLLLENEVIKSLAPVDASEIYASIREICVKDLERMYEHFSYEITVEVNSIYNDFEFQISLLSEKDLETTTLKDDSDDVDVNVLDHKKVMSSFDNAMGKLETYINDKNSRMLASWHKKFAHNVLRSNILKIMPISKIDAQLIDEKIESVGKSFSIDSVVTDKAINDILENEKSVYDAFLREKATAEAVPKKKTIREALNLIPKLPGRILAPFAGISIFMVLFGIGSMMGWIKSVTGELKGPIVIISIVSLFIVFAIMAIKEVRSLREKKIKDATNKLKIKCKDKYKKTLESYKKQYLSAFKLSIIPAVENSLIKPKAEIELWCKNNKRKWVRECEVIAEKSSKLDKQIESLEEIQSAVGLSLKLVGDKVKDLRKVIGVAK